MHTQVRRGGAARSPAARCIYTRGRLAHKHADWIQLGQLAVAANAMNLPPKVCSPAGHPQHTGCLMWSAGTSVVVQSEIDVRQMRTISRQHSLLCCKALQHVWEALGPQACRNPSGSFECWAMQGLPPTLHNIETNRHHPYGGPCCAGRVVGSVDTGGGLRAAPVVDPWHGMLWVANHAKQLLVIEAPGGCISLCRRAARAAGGADAFLRTLHSLHTGHYKFQA